MFLNDASLLDADNMFRTWRVDCKRLLKAGANTLRIRFRSPINEILPVMAKMKYELPAGNDQGEKTSPHTRKAPYQYGWDWGPALRHQRHLASGFPGGLGPGARRQFAHRTEADQRRCGQPDGGCRCGFQRSGTAVVIVDNLNDKSIAAKREVKLAPGANRIGA